MEGIQKKEDYEENANLIQMYLEKTQKKFRNDSHGDPYRRALHTAQLLLTTKSVQFVEKKLKFKTLQRAKCEM